VGVSRFEMENQAHQRRQAEALEKVAASLDSIASSLRAIVTRLELVMDTTLHVTNHNPYPGRSGYTPPAGGTSTG